MRSHKLKKLLKQIKKLKKSKKSKRGKKPISKNVKLSAELDALKDKIKIQELQLSQVRNPQPAPVSRVSYETMGIGQQNALNQANLENIEKKYVKNFEEQEKALKKYYDDKLLIDREQSVLKSDNIGDFKEKRFASSNQTVINPSIQNKYNSFGRPQKPIYSTTDNEGDFPRINFNSDVYSQFDKEVEQTENESKENIEEVSDLKAVAQPVEKEPRVIQSLRLRPQKEGESNEEYKNYIKKAGYNRNYRSRQLIRKELESKPAERKFTSPKILSQKESALKIPGISDENIQQSIDLSKQIEKQNKQIKQKEIDIFNTFSK